MAKATKQPFVIPSDKNSIKSIQSAVKEASNSLLRIQAEKDLLKEIAEVVNDEHNLPKADFNRMAKVYFKSEYAKLTNKHEEFNDLYESVMAGVDPDLTEL